MHNSKKPLVLALFGAMSIGYTVSANAWVHWEFPDHPTNCVETDPSGNCGGGDSNFANSRTYSGDDGTTSQNGTLVTVEGWSSTGDVNSGSNNALQRGQITHYSGGLGVQNADAVDYGLINNGNTQPGTGHLSQSEKNVLAGWETQFGVDFSGPNPLPVENNMSSAEANAIRDLLDPLKDEGEQASPEHAVDNNDRFDLVLFDFGTQQVSLSGVLMGYVSGDSDISVLALKEGGDHSLAGIEYSDSVEGLTGPTGNWEHIGDYSNVGVNSLAAINSGGFHSTHWIIAAYNPVFDSSKHWTTGNDAFKIELVKGELYNPGPDPSPAPVPGTALLLISGLAAIRYRRKMKSE